MDITEFFELSAGKWFSQRTVHNLTSGQLQAGKSELKIDLLPANDPAVTKLCEQHAINPTQAGLAGARATWKVMADLHQTNGSKVMVLIPNPDNSNSGKLLQDKIASRYTLGNDVLTLITESDTLYVEERWWYLMPNLRLRSSIVKQLNGLAQASFCSEIRMGVTQPPAETVSATTQK